MKLKHIETVLYQLTNILRDIVDTKEKKRLCGLLAIKGSLVNISYGEIQNVENVGKEDIGDTHRYQL